MQVAFVSSAVPRRCGLATFTSDLTAAVRAADPAVKCIAAAIDEPGAERAYDDGVVWRIRQGDRHSYAAAARAISASNVDVVNVQHEFGLFGVWRDDRYDDHFPAFLAACTKPVVTTLHTLPPRPEPWMREAIRAVSAGSDAVVVMAATGRQLLRDVYGTERTPVLIEHGMPPVEPRGRRRLKRSFGFEDRRIICTFGLVDPRKGLEHVVRAMPQILARHPSALYLVVGQTHPELVKHQGEAYRESLEDIARGLGVADQVRYVNEYLTQSEIVDYLLATDVYVTPYLDPNQITSGTLAYALGAGKAIVSTPYLHALEALADGRGVLVPFRDPAALATAVGDVLANPAWQAALEADAYAYGSRVTWPVIGGRVLDLMRDVVAARAMREAPAPTGIA